MFYFFRLLDVVVVALKAASTSDINEAELPHAVYLCGKGMQFQSQLGKNKVVLDKSSEMNIIELLLTTFEVCWVF